MYRAVTMHFYIHGREMKDEYRVLLDNDETRSSISLYPLRQVDELAVWQIKAC